MKKKLLAVAAIVAPALMFVPVAPASASSVCLPITIDGQPVCQDTTPVDQAVAQAEATLATVEAQALGLVRSTSPSYYDGIGHCDAVHPESNGVVVTFGQYVPNGTVEECVGYELPVEADAGTTTIPAHVPQVCLTTTGTCVGGIDTSVPVPALAYTICMRSWQQYYDQYGTAYMTTYGAGPCVPAV